MRDSEIVASIVAGDPDGLAEAYDRYANALFGFCRTLLREPADAADAVQDTFLIAASRVGGLRDPELLRPWLYAVARNECLRRLGSREAASALDEATEHAGTADETADVGAEAERAERRALLRAALGGLNTAERDVVTQLLHGLDVAEIALVLGASRNHVHSLLSRARDQLEASVGVLLVARFGRQDCAELDTLLAGWDGELTVLWRKRLIRHIDRCAVCSQRRRQVLSPAVLLGLSPGLLLGVFAARAANTPPAAGLAEMAHEAGAAGVAHEAGAAAVAHEADTAGAAHLTPAGLRAKTLQMATSKDLHAQAYRDALKRSHGSFRTSGFPKPMRTSHPWLPHAPRATVIAAIGAAAVIAAAIVLAMSLGPHRGGISGAGPLPGQRVGQTPSGASGQPGGTASGVPGGTRSTSPGAGPSSGPGGSSVSASPLASRSGPSGGPPGPSPSVSRTGSPSGSGSPTPSRSSTSSTPTASPTVTPTGSGSATPHPTPTPTPTPTRQPAPGTLTVTPTTIVLSPVLGETITLTAEGGPVNWSVSEPSSLLGELTVAPSSGTLQSGQSAQVTITVSGLASLDTQLTVSPGGQQVTVVLGLL
jgi:RNA polymerase sigma factor (sigma-70 family)